MTRPTPGSDGDLAHLTYGSVRWHVGNGVRLLVTTGGDTSGFYWKIVRGLPVVVTREQLEGFISANDRASLGLPDVSAHAAWLLQGDSTLSPA